MGHGEQPGTRKAGWSPRGNRSLTPSPYSHRPLWGRVWTPAEDAELKNPAGFVFHYSRLASPTGSWYNEQSLAEGTGADQSL